MTFQEMGDDDLREFWWKNHRRGAKRSIEVIGYRARRPIVALNALSNYAINLVAQRSCMRRGDTIGADVYQFAMDLCLHEAFEAGVALSDWVRTNKSQNLRSR